MTSALELRNISKQFGATRALSGVDFTVEHGEVHAILGENGSGKSTLIKVLAGVHVPEPGGTLTADGREVSLPLAPGAFRDIGLSFVHQDLGLARPLTVLENLLGTSAQAAQSRWKVPWRRERARAKAMLASYGVSIDPDTVVDDLPPVGQALVAIARAGEDLKQYRVRTGATSSVLVLDEPTVFLPEEELHMLFDLIRSVVASGSSVIFISHDLPAVRAIADRVTVLRDGRVVATATMNEVTDQEIVGHIVGAAKADTLHEHGRSIRAGAPTADSSAERRMVVRNLRGGQLLDFSLDVAAGEIVGVAGLLGSGSEDVPYLLFGARRAAGGTASIASGSHDLTKQNPAAAVAMGMSFIPADRQRDGIAREISVAQNMMLLVVDKFRRGGRLRNGDVRATSDNRAEAFDVRPRRTDLPIGTLSGGNAQKVVLAKWLETKPAVLLLHEPTQGVDIAARAQIYRTIIGAANDGMSVVWVTSDFEELATTCDRVVIVNSGRIAAELVGGQINLETITTGVYAANRSGAAAVASIH